jgi:glycine/D-amino acid oxidase-like deaminating enzyme
VGDLDFYRMRSLWLETAGDLTPREPLPGDTDADIAIVGGGMTGLWTAYYLAEADPSLRIVIVEKDITGFGASGRNGGWCTPFYGPTIETIAKEHGRASAIAMQRTMLDAIAEMGRACEADGIDAEYRMEGAIMSATDLAQAGRLREAVATFHSFGFGEDEFRVLSADETEEYVRARGVVCSFYIPHAAAVNPGKLTRGLALACESRGVKIHEQTAAVSIDRGSVATEHGRVRADVIVRATEAYTSSLRRHERLLAPIEDAMIATEPLPASFWNECWSGQALFSDEPHMFIYAQRTTDDRIAVGGGRAGVRYHYGARTPDPSPFESAWEALRGRLVELFPDVADAKITHRWSGYIGYPRNYRPSVGFRRDLGVAWAGGYVGDGNPNSNLAGRTLRDLILGRDTDLVRLPWVDQRWRLWEPEPLSWLGITGSTKVASLIDRTEARTGKRSALTRVAELLGVID